MRNVGIFTLNRLEELQKALVAACSRETSADPELWTPENPLWGHCVVAVCVVQDFLGGDILWYDLRKIPEFARLVSHYRNQVADGIVLDFTAPQFGTDSAAHLIGTPFAGVPEITRRERLLNPEKYQETIRRYEIFAERLYQNYMYQW